MGAVHEFCQADEIALKHPAIDAILLREVAFWCFLHGLQQAKSVESYYGKDKYILFV